MKALCAMAAVALSLAGATAPASAQPRGGPDYDYGERGPGYGERGPGYGERGPGYGDRGPGYGERDPGYRERGSGSRGREAGFDEREYLRCNPDVRRAVDRGQMESGFVHYRTFGRREGRRLNC
ncbi:hypothetical protein OPKNFCMD_4962 [Methylobacterium crusticola]|uniref:Lectin-like protein BA14k n=1 Tax=Methylobacterium crusticola TaxID=1697972 RepID=A0ABQ4R3E4_9HYPH|nr:hypothetical protein [Methylobacterium crusticola]GJD52200.1 hypothetical protein OPKNFCMD_4962 [Methylobacterium crusticola]